MPAFTAVLFPMAERWKETKGPLVGEWINKIWYKHTVECNSAIKKE